MNVLTRYHEIGLIKKYHLRLQNFMHKPVIGNNRR